jgi:transposase
MFSNSCIICGSIIEGERLNALINVLNLSPEQWKCKVCAETDTRKVKGLYTGFSGASDMILTDSLGSHTGISYLFPEINERARVEEDSD